MEILKFSEPGRRSGRSRTDNKSGLMPLVSFGIAVLVLGGMSTTLAGTITLGSNSSVEFGQGIVNATACDDSINVTPSTTFDTSNAGSFKVTRIQLTGIGIGKDDTTSASIAVGCIAKKFTLKAYNSFGEALPFTDASGGNSNSFLKFKLFNDTLTALGPELPTVEDGSNGQFAKSGSWLERTNSDSAGIVTITNFLLSSAVTRITLETSS